MITGVPLPVISEGTTAATRIHRMSELQIARNVCSVRQTWNYGFQAVTRSNTLAHNRVNSGWALPDLNRADFASLVRWARILCVVFFPKFLRGSGATEEKVGWALPDLNQRSPGVP